jgi:outer membrane lipoprotein
MPLGCASVISQELRDQVDKELTFKEVLQDPESYKGKIVLWSGVIIETENQQEGTFLKILQKPADPTGRPRDTDESDGRFLALHSEFLDDAVYTQGREVTVGGEVLGERVMPLGEIEYHYPLVLVKEIYLWPTLKRQPFYPYPHPYYPYPPWHDPWWWYYPPPGYYYR